MGRAPAAVMGWLRARPLLADGLLALLLASFSLVALGYGNRDCDGSCRPGGWPAVALVLLQTLPLAWRRQRPLAVSLATGLATAAYGFAPWPDLAMPVPIGGVVGLYSVAAWGGRRAALVAGGVAVAIVVVVMSLPETDADLVDAAFGSLALVGAWVLGDRARIQRAWTAELQERAVHLERERAGEARRAVAEERARIARELHDVVAHHVSMMVVQAEAGPLAVERDPALAAGAFDAVAGTGRQALVEMRRLLGVLRGDGDPAPSLAPQPGMAQVAALVEQVGRAGLQVELLVEGEPAPLPAGVDLSAYRIVQEALTNAVKHGGPGRARVLVRYGEHDLELRVCDKGPGPGRPPADGDGSESATGDGVESAARDGVESATGDGVESATGDGVESTFGRRPGDSGRQTRRPGRPGRGLVGMRERVNLFGGDLHAGPRPEGGFEVVARLPTGGPTR